MTHEASTADFSGSIPEHYDRYLGPVMFEPYAVDLVARLPGNALRVLEIACGTGVLTRRLSEALPPGTRIVATDLNEAMVAYARKQGGTPGVEWLTADALALPFADSSFDLVVCQFGVMFFPDKPKGLAEARRVLAPGGVFIANVWRSLAENTSHAAMQEALERLFPADPPRFFDVPYGYHDWQRLRADLTAAGWDAVVRDEVSLTGHGDSASEFATGFVYGSPLFHYLAASGRELGHVVAELAAAVAAIAGSRPCRPELRATVIRAER